MKPTNFQAEEKNEARKAKRKSQDILCLPESAKKYIG